MLVAEANDEQNRLARSATYAWATGSGISGWQRFDDHRLDMVADKKQARPGDSLKLLIKNPFAKATALVTVERQGVSRTQVVPVEGPSPVVEVPIREQDAPGVYVGVLLIRGRNAPFKPGSPDLGRPQVRIGYAPLKVDSSLEGPRVQVSTQAEKFRPGQEVKARLSVTLNGKPIASEVTLLAVDERILFAAKGDNSYDPAKTFDRMPPLGVMSADLRTKVLGRFALDGKGDGVGGGGGMSPAVRRKFLPAVFWLAQAATNEKGMLSASFKLPDSLTAYRIVAVAGLKDGRFGLGQTKVTASLPLQMLSALPRFAVKGDEFKARVLVQNLAEKPAKVEVSIAQPQGAQADRRDKGHPGPSCPARAGPQASPYRPLKPARPRSTSRPAPQSTPTRQATSWISYRPPRLRRLPPQACLPPGQSRWNSTWPSQRARTRRAAAWISCSRLRWRQALPRLPRCC